MSYEVLQALGNWPTTSHGASVARVVDAASFSEARVWRVEAAGRAYALKSWPGIVSAERLQDIHDFQCRLAGHFPSLIPVLQRTVHDETMVCVSQRLWELATWMPGAADFTSNPSAARLDAAMRALAAIHNKPISLREGYVYDDGSPILLERQYPRSLEQRVARLDQILSGDLRSATAVISNSAPADERGWLLDAIERITQLAPGELRKAYQLNAVQLPRQYRLGDAHEGHFLFTKDEVTGVIDFGAADYDTPAGDVARLLGGLVGDNRDLWQRGLTAYSAVRPMTDVELRAVEFFDSSGTVISAANWINWLWGDAEKRLTLSDYARPRARLSRLTERLQVLASRTR